MGEKASVFQVVQIGIESVPGTPVAATKKLLACSLVPGVKTEMSVFRALGNKYPSFTTLNKEWSEASIEGHVTYNEILYLLSSLLSMPSPVQQGATAAYKWTFVSDTDGEDAGKTFTVEQGDANNAWEAPGMRVSGLELSFSRRECSLGGAAVGEAIDTSAALTSGCTSLTPRPVLPSHLALRLADTQTGLAGATPITRGFSFTWSLTDKVALAWPIGQDPVLVEKEPTLEAKLKVAADATGMGLLATMRAGDTKWIQIKAEGATIAAPYKYTLQIDAAYQIKDVANFADEENIYAVEYSLAGIHDATWTKAFQIDVIADVSAL